ncbi:MAG: tRNA pseudouridine(55) synthase TruB [candidate division WOR-3 bacterium]
MRLRGILLVNKPTTLTSYDVIRKLKSIFPKNKIGHAGTLDPIADGLLLILFNEATKIAQYLSSADKEYVAKIRLGIITDTDDITGKIIAQKEPLNITIDQIENGLSLLAGKKEQIPPRFSALKLEGKRAYKLARQGIDFTLKPRPVNIKSIAVVDFSQPTLTIKLTVSTGTYIRAIARDLGEILGCGATLQNLTRIKIGKFSLANAINLAEINPKNIHDHLQPINEALAELSAITANQKQLKKLLNGQPILFDQDDYLKNGTSTVRIIDDENRMLILAKIKNNKIYPMRVIYADLSAKTE